MNAESDTKPDCPVGENQCQHIDELTRLRSENDSLSQLLRTDTLTGLYNYRHFSEALEAELDRSRRTLQPTSLLMIDLDYFKGINDTWGHENGNLVLQRAAAVMREAVRKIDVVCRYGGEEFAIILPATTVNKAVQVAERIRNAIEHASVELDVGLLQFTASLGANSYQPPEIVSADQFIHQTDQFLYQAKHAGRNRVAHPTLEPEKARTEVSLDEKAALMGLI